MTVPFLVISLIAGSWLANAQTAAPQWRRVGGTTVSEGLAGPATGPVRSVWYSAQGDRLLAQTAAGRVFETTDFEHWRLNSTESAPLLGATTPSATLPEAGARIQTASARMYATGRGNIYASEDNGRTWLNLTGFNGRSILGGGFNALAVSPANSQELAAANQAGVWRSVDGGLSWRGLNDDLPNLMARKLTGRRTAALADSSLIVFDSGMWTHAEGVDPEIALQEKGGRNFSAAAQAGSMIYGGSSDGRLFVSRDSGATWSEAQRVTAAAIERIWVDTERPESALAAAGTRLLRTVNGGTFWDDVTGTLPESRIHGITADRTAGVVYLATDRGVVTGKLSLNDAGPAATDWSSLSRDLPAAVGWDVRLNADNTLSAVLDGYGVFETPAPHRSRTIRIVNGADMSDRPAAPGSLISVLGANVKQGISGTLQYPIIAASDQSSQLQVPFEAAAGVFQIALDGASDRWTAPLTVKEASPAIFVDSDGSPLLLDSASGLVLDPNVAVHAGTVVQILATGLGKVSPDWPTGVPAPLDSPPVVRGTVTAWLDGTPVQVSRATLAPGYVGYYMVEMQIPAIVNRGSSELRIVMNGQESNRVKLYLEPDRVQ